MRNELRAFITENFLFGESGLFSDDDSLLEQGMIDSTGVLELVAFLEKTYGIEVQDADLVPDNLDSVNGLIRYIETKRAAYARNEC